MLKEGYLQLRKKVVKLFNIIICSVILFTILPVNYTALAYSPHSVPSKISRNWNDIRGGKDYSKRSGKKLVYDVYSKKYTSGGYKIVNKDFGKGSQPYLNFQGWAVLFGYKRHTSSNHETYIVAQNTSNSKNVKIYKTKHINISATEDLEYNNQGSGVWNECPANATKKDNELDCNMRYDNVGFDAYLPLNELFPDNTKSASWRLYIVKEVDGHIVYAPLVLPFSFSNKSFRYGTISLSSGVNSNNLIMNGYHVLRRDYPRQTARDFRKKHGKSKYFTPDRTYKMVSSDESRTTVWYGVRSPHDNNSTKWGSSAYWQFAGSQATLSFTPEKVPPEHIFHSSGYFYRDGNNYWVRENTSNLGIILRQYDAGVGNKYQYLRLNGSGVDVRARHDFEGSSTNKTNIYTNSKVTITSAKRLENTKFGKVEWRINVNGNTHGDSYNIQYYYTDRANNAVGYKNTGMVLKVDGRAPTVSFRNASDTRDYSYDNTPDTETVEVLMKFSDDGSGVKRYRYRWSTTSEKQHLGTFYDADSQNRILVKSKPLPNDEIYLHVELEDNVGNVGYYVAGPYKIKRKAVVDFYYEPTEIYNDTKVRFRPYFIDNDYDKPHYETIYEWDYRHKNDTRWHRIATSTGGTEHIFTKKGEYDISMYVEIVDTINWQTVWEEIIIKPLEVLNRPPVADFEYSPEEIYTDTPVEFTSLSYDVDGDDLYYSWLYSPPPEWFRVRNISVPDRERWFLFSEVENATSIFDTPGEYKIKHMVADRYDGQLHEWDEMTKTIYVIDKSIYYPKADFTYSPDTIYNDTVVSFTNLSTNPVEDEDLTYKWEYQEPGKSSWTEFSSEFEPSRIFNKKGIWKIRLTATNSWGSDSVTKELNVQNRSPIASFNYEPLDVYVDTPVDFINDSTDPDGDSLTYQWEYKKPNSSNWETFSTSKDPSNIPLNIGGDWEVRLTVSDGSLSDVDSKVIHVKSYPVPVADFEYQPSTIYIDTNVSFINYSYIRDNSPLAYKWEYQKPNSSNWVQFSTEREPEQVFNQKGVWNIRLTVTGAYGSDSVEKLLYVQNREPIADFEISSYEVRTGTTVDFINRSTDPDGDALTYIWEYQKPDSTDWVQFSTLTNPSTSFDEGGIWKIRLTASDGELNDTTVKELTVYVNRPPVADFIYSPETIYNDTTVIFQNLSYDPDGDPLTYVWRYRKPGSQSWTLFSGAKNPKRIFQKGTWEISLTVNDGYESVTTIKTINVQNRAPIADFYYSPTTVYNNTDVTFTNTSRDPDGDSLTYKWEYRKPNSSEWVQFSTTKDSNKVLDQIGNWTIRLTAIDEDGANDSVTKNITVQNRKPELIVEYSPENPYEGDKVNICITVEDADKHKSNIDLYIQKEGESKENVASWEKVDSGITVCYTFTPDEPVRYDIEVTADDGYDDTKENTWFNAQKLFIIGHVNHTPEWEKRHLELGHTLDQFYSGEKFLLEADVADYSIDDIKAIFRAYQVDGEPINRTIPLSRVSNVLYDGELFDEKFLNYPTKIRVGPAHFYFEVLYSNGVKKEAVVPVTIIEDSIYDAYKFHRNF